ncbi:hypothetical Protein psc5_00120 [Candidatus Phytoplasma solani]
MKLIIFEGLDGSGKTSLIKSVKRELKKQGKEVIVIRVRCFVFLDNFLF